MIVKKHSHVLLAILSSTSLWSSLLYSQNIKLDGRTYTPIEGRQMANAYGYVTSLQGITRYTVRKCSKWLPAYQLKYRFIYKLWRKRNQVYFSQNKKMYSDLVNLVSHSSGKPKKEVNLFYRGMTNTAVKRFKTILLRKELNERTLFCHNFSARLASGILDIKLNKTISIFMENYKPLANGRV